MQETELFGWLSISGQTSQDNIENIPDISVLLVAFEPVISVFVLHETVAA
jgi:hypothetical protein